MRTRTSRRAGVILAALALAVTTAVQPAAAASRTSELAPPGAPPPVVPLGRPIQQATAINAPASLAKTGLAVMSPWFLRPAAEPSMTDAQRAAFNDQMVADLVEAKVKLVRLEIAASGESAVDMTLYQQLLDKLPSDVKVIAVLNFALVEGGVTNSGVPASEPYLYQLQDSVAVSQYPEYGTTTKFMKVWIDKALSVVTKFKSKLAAVEVLNEANKLYHPGTAAHPGPYVAPPDAYGRLIAKFYRYCKLAGSKPCGTTVQVITHGMHPAMDGGDSGTSNDDTVYLKAFLRSASVAAFKSANSSKWPFDGIGYHPYPFAMGLSLPGGYANTPTSTLLTGISGRLDALRTVLNGESVPQATSLLWLTEVGFNSNDVSASTLDEKEAKQGQYLRDVYTALSARADVAQAIWYRYHEGNAAAPAENWGLTAFTNRSYAQQPPRYKRAFCDFVWQRGVSASEHCIVPKAVSYQYYFNNIMYPVSYYHMPQFIVSAGGTSYPFWQVEQQWGSGPTKLLSGDCSSFDPYVCSTSDYSRPSVPSTADGAGRFRVRFSGYPNVGPWSDWMSFSALVGTATGVYGPPSGATLNFKTQYVSFPVAVPVQWLLNHPGAQPYLRFHEDLPGGGWTRLFQLPSMPPVPDTAQETTNHALHIFNVNITSSTSRNFIAGPVEFRFGIAPAACKTDLSQCVPINAAESFTFAFNHS